MIVISAREFNHQSRIINNSSERVFYKKRLNPGVIFSARQREAAVNYCLTWMKNNQSSLCVLVEDIHQLQVWYEQLNRQRIRNITLDVSDLSTENNIEKSLLESQYLQIDREFIDRCQKVLTESIGPIARIIIQKMLSQDNQSSREQFLNRLIQELQHMARTKDPTIEENLRALLNS